MIRKLIIVTAMLALAAGTASAQDARAVLQASLKAMGGENLKTITYSGAGWTSRIGQTYGLTEDWPKYEVANYTRVVDYDAKWSREDYERRQGNYPTLGGVPMAEQHITQILSGTYAWDMNGETVRQCTRPYLDGVPYTDLRQLELALTPHGVLKAALAASSATAITLPIIGASDFGLSQFGRKVTIVIVPDSRRQVQDQRDDQRSESRRAGRHLVPQPGLRRHGLRDALHELQGLRRREVPRAAPRAPGRSAAEPGAQLLRDDASRA